MLKRIILFLNLAFTIIMVISINIVVGLDYKITYHDASLKEFTSGVISSQDVGDLQTVTITVNSMVKDFSYPCTLNKDSSYEDVQAYKQAQRKAAKDYFTSENLAAANSMKVKGYRERYISKYSPIIEYNYDIDTFTSNYDEILANISSSRKVKTVDVYGYGKKSNIVPNLINTSSSDICSFEEIYIDRDYTGAGVNVGLLDGGIIDENHVNIANSNYLIRNEWYYIETVHDHPTLMASIIGGNNGIAIDARIMSVELFTFPTEEVEWLLDNDVDVVNMSFGFENNPGVYDNMSAYFDYISKTYGVTFIAAVGNSENNEYKVTNPALGYNVIGVGGSIYSNQFFGATCTEVDSGPFKPNIVAPAAYLVIPNCQGSSGTSLSCAITTGVVAALMEKHPYLKVRPDMVMAILNSGATFFPVGPDETVENGYNNYTGAGILNYHRSEADYRVLSRSLSINAEGSLSPYIFHECEMMYEGETLTVCVSSLAYANGDADDTKYPYIGINVFREGEELFILKGVYSDRSNVTFMNYTIPEDGYYVIEVVHFDQPNITYPYEVAYSWHIG